MVPNSNAAGGVVDDVIRSSLSYRSVCSVPLQSKHRLMISGEATALAQLDLALVAIPPQADIEVRMSYYRQWDSNRAKVHCRRSGKNPPHWSTE
ncbi:hypothetical protein CORC01_05204 [Colletotrichum orchidophilum]|uniref:Uncharacterized protein n=1 Tax=Colletotrichum orchidophilum TaxID=1209926 RepID=A0A1G4BDC5_9PEZI|nr:uncharacterized protein CORC01_05204 [Colletotrichum orchidophilum]OHE99404.1 hypothetical protein CORC01_05204 [Colletotrichum orchidophilum]